jgi:xanthine dehydrogenase accessory factor
MDHIVLERLNAARRARRAAIVATDLSSGVSRLITEDDDVSGDPLAVDLTARFGSGASSMARAAGAGEVFLTVHLPPPRLVIIGAVHVSQALAPMALLAGFETTIIDPRTAFATPERFPDVRLVPEWPQDVLAREPLDSHTALAAITHDPKIDDHALTAAMTAGCFYIGALGSRKTHARRRQRLGDAGVSETDLDLIRAPIGLDIKAQSPSEIAVAVLAEIIGTLRRRGLGREQGGGGR